MWLDSETSIDYINFATIAGSVVELIEQADGKPLSIGVSGAWGTGKSSLIKLTREALSKSSHEAEIKYEFVEFNAWLYQGYDDARAALLETIGTKLAEVAKEKETGSDKTREFLERIDWFRAASLVGGSAVALALGLPPVGLIGQVTSWFGRAGNGVDGEVIEDGQGLIEKMAAEGKTLIKNSETEESPRQRIEALRRTFEEALEELDIRLVVLIDDLDRCLPETAVSTLEAIRLFLFLDRTAFVIAADDEMIKHAVRKHFDDPSTALVTNYFDKLIQIPIRVPTLGTQEVRAYMFLLFVHQSSLGENDQETIRIAVCEQLKDSWRGKRVDRAFVQSLGVSLPAPLAAQLDTAERLTPLMATATGIAGNPRLIKRFMNTLSIRMAVARSQGVTVDEQVLAKLLLFERLAPPELYLQLAAAITDSADGKPAFLRPLEPGGDGQTEGLNMELWGAPFAKEWLNLAPPLSDEDMRGAIYVSREHLPVVHADAGLSAQAAEVLEALVHSPSEAAVLRSDITALNQADLQTVFDKLIDVARREDLWGVPAILDALLEIARGGEHLGTSLAGFLGERPPTQIDPSIVPKIRQEKWAPKLFDKWTNDSKVAGPVKKAIKQPAKAQD
ncbi:MULTISPECIES: P-loop NTPase fold protein [unclassified Aeromicrobium]|uniref:KAP family P-loop NTPase fold protein n=1 Tax=unclassified Aeromicrobium TaxID=2633570 RepID=UPI00396B2A16